MRLEEFDISVKWLLKISEDSKRRKLESSRANNKRNFCTPAKLNHFRNSLCEFSFSPNGMVGIRPEIISHKISWSEQRDKKKIGLKLWWDYDSPKKTLQSECKCCNSWAIRSTPKKTYSSGFSCRSCVKKLHKNSSSSLARTKLLKERIKIKIISQINSIQKNGNGFERGEEEYVKISMKKFVFLLLPEHDFLSKILT